MILIHLYLKKEKNFLTSLLIYYYNALYISTIFVAKCWYYFFLKNLNIYYFLKFKFNFKIKFILNFIIYFKKITYVSLIVLKYYWSYINKNKKLFIYFYRKYHYFKFLYYYKYYYYYYFKKKMYNKRIKFYKKLYMLNYSKNNKKLIYLLTML